MSVCVRACDTEPTATPPPTTMRVDDAGDKTTDNVQRTKILTTFDTRVPEFLTLHI
jgi:hypothetical protein